LYINICCFISDVRSEVNFNYGTLVRLSYRFKTVFNGDVVYMTQLKQQKFRSTMTLLRRAAKVIAPF